MRLSRISGGVAGTCRSLHPVVRVIGWCAVLGAGCAHCTTGNSGNDNDNQTPSELSFQLAPSGRAVAGIDPDGFAELLDLSRTESGSRLQPIVENYVRAFAAEFSNDADFVIFTLDAHRTQLRFNAVGGFNIAVRVPEAGLGPFVPVTSFADLPNLRGFIYLARKDSLVLGPALHELAHGWGVRLRAPQILGTQSALHDNHWGFGGVGGQMGGWLPGSLVDLGERQFTLSSGNVEPRGRSFNTTPYAPLELYLMGLAGPESVEPIEFAVNPTPTTGSLFEFSAEGIVSVTIAEIVEANGRRVPSADAAPKSFKLALIILADHALTPQEWQFYEDSMAFFASDELAEVRQFFPDERYEGQPILDLLAQPDPEDPQRRFINFFEATHGLATVEFVTLQKQAAGS